MPRWQCCVGRAAVVATVVSFVVVGVVGGSCRDGVGSSGLRATGNGGGAHVARRCSRGSGNAGGGDVERGVALVAGLVAAMVVVVVVPVPVVLSAVAAAAM